MKNKMKITQVKLKSQKVPSILLEIIIKKKSKITLLIEALNLKLKNPDQTLFQQVLFNNKIKEIYF
jgi:hypothetical protein